jgi:hypothetical protein
MNVTLNMKVSMSVKKDRDCWLGNEMTGWRRSAETENSKCCYVCSKAIIKYVVMRRPRFGNEYCRSNLLTVSGYKYAQYRE